MARALPSPFLATLSDSDTARARYAFKELIPVLILEKASLLESFCFKATAAPALFATLKTYVTPPDALRWTTRLLLAEISSLPLLSLPGLILWLSFLNKSLIRRLLILHFKDLFKIKK